MSQAGVSNDKPSNVPLIFETDSGNAIPAGNVLKILGGTGATTSGAGNVITITVTTASFNWNLVTSATNVNQIVKENGYICNGSNLVKFLLPLAPAIGDSFIIISNTARFEINQNGGQQICVGTAAATAGSGKATSNSTGDEVEFVYLGSNIFRAFAPQGILTLT